MLRPGLWLPRLCHLTVCWWQQGSAQEDVGNSGEKTQDCEEENLSQGYTNLQSRQVLKLSEAQIKFLFRIIFRSLSEDMAATFSRWEFCQVFHLTQRSPLLSRIRRDVLEGTLEEMFDGNLTTSELVKRQASGFPGTSERNTDRSK